MPMTVGGNADLMLLTVADNPPIEDVNVPSCRLIVDLTIAELILPVRSPPAERTGYGLIQWDAVDDRPSGINTGPRLAGSFQPVGHVHTRWRNAAGQCSDGGARSRNRLEYRQGAVEITVTNTADSGPVVAWAIYAAMPTANGLHCIHTGRRTSYADTPLRNTVRDVEIDGGGSAARQNLAGGTVCRYNLGNRIPGLGS